LIELVRRVLPTIPSPSSEDDDSRRQYAHATTSTTSSSTTSLSEDDGGGGGDAKPEAPVSEQVVVSVDKWTSFAHLGGLEEVIEKLLVEVVVPLCCPELPRNLGVRPVAGLLLHGPPGCGKTTLVHAIANETGVPFYKISAPDIVSGISGMFSTLSHNPITDWEN